MENEFDKPRADGKRNKLKEKDQEKLQEWTKRKEMPDPFQQA